MLFFDVEGNLKPGTHCRKQESKRKIAKMTANVTLHDVLLIYHNLLTSIITVSKIENDVFVGI